MKPWLRFMLVWWPLTVVQAGGGHPATVDVELDVFSGRANPTWRLDVDEAEALLALLTDLPPAAADADGLPGLGYRGFIVRRRDAAQTTNVWRICAGSVVREGDRRADFRGAEAWLLRHARERGLQELVDALGPR